MAHFWRHGFHRSSIEDLVAATGVSRHGLYLEFGDKRGLFMASLGAYVADVVDPAIGPLELDAPSFGNLRNFFEHHIRRAERDGLPGPGCLIANTLTEIAPHDPDIAAAIKAHIDRLTKGFARALGIASCPPDRMVDLEQQAAALVTFANGLWSVSRVTRDADIFRRMVDTILAAVEGETANG